MCECVCEWVIQKSSTCGNNWCLGTSWLRAFAGMVSTVTLHQQAMVHWLQECQFKLFFFAPVISNIIFIFINSKQIRRVVKQLWYVKSRPSWMYVTQSFLLDKPLSSPELHGLLLTTSPVDTWCNDNVIIMSKPQRCCDVIMTLLHCFDVIMTLLCCVHAGMQGGLHCARKVEIRHCERPADLGS